MKAYALLATLCPAVVFAGAPVIIAQQNPEPFKLAADAVRKILPDAALVDPSKPEIGSLLGQASVIVAVGQKALGVARDSGTPAPIVFCLVLGASRSSVGGHIMGVPFEADPSSTLVSLRAAVPNLHRVGVIYDPKSSELVMDKALEAAKSMGLTLVLKPVAGAAEVRGAVEPLPGAVDLLWLPPNSKLFSPEVFSYLLGFTAERKLPLVGFLDTFTDQGAVASVSSDYSAIGELAGKMAADVVAGKHPPSLQFARGRFSLNLKTAKALGIDVPDAAQKDARVVR
jgi:putative ABC transport system substrate-binding protein